MSSPHYSWDDGVGGIWICSICGGAIGIASSDRQHHTDWHTLMAAITDRLGFTVDGSAERWLLARDGIDEEAIT